MFRQRAIATRFNLLTATTLALWLGGVLVFVQVVSSVGDRFVRYQSHVAERQSLVHALHAGLGCGGVVNHFQRYIIRGEESDYEKVLTGLVAVRESVARFRQLPEVGRGEAMALDNVEVLLAHYEDGVERAKAMWAAGKSPPEIDLAVRVDDGPALESLAILHAGVSRQAAAHRLEMSEILGHGQRWVVWGGVLGMLFLLVMVHLTRRAIVGPLMSVVEALEDLASGEADLTRRLVLPRDRELHRLVTAFNAFTERVETLVSRIVAATVHMEAEARRMSDLANRTNLGVDSHQTQVEQVLILVTQLAESAQGVAGNAADSASAVEDANRLTHDGSQVVSGSISALDGLASEVNKVAATIEALQTDTQSIGSVLDVIREIAEQTNLLALNAAIEAARAGAQGRGFAVVAEEVRALAQRTRDSTSEIRSMVERLQESADAAVEGMERSRGTAAKGVEQGGCAVDSLAAITETIGQVNERSTGIAAAAAQQKTVCDDVRQNVVAVNEIARNNADTAREADEISDRIVSLGRRLTEVVQEFRVREQNHFNLTRAVIAHRSWVNRLDSFLSGGSTLTEAEVVDHRACEFGRWYYGPEGEAYRDLPDMRALEQPHKDLHALARELIGRVEAGEHDAARSGLDRIRRLSKEIAARVKKMDAAVSG